MPVQIVSAKQQPDFAPDCDRLLAGSDSSKLIVGSSRFAINHHADTFTTVSHEPRKVRKYKEIQIQQTSSGRAAYSVDAIAEHWRLWRDVLGDNSVHSKQPARSQYAGPCEIGSVLVKLN
jgi:hypothetical protein